MLKQLVIRFFPAKRLALGRWCLNDKSKNYWKIDMANIDHCGTCTLKKEKITIDKNLTKVNNENHS